MEILEYEIDSLVYVRYFTPQSGSDRVKGESFHHMNLMLFEIEVHQQSVF